MEILMKSTLKSLLITSMLTLPSVFASHSILETESDTPPAAATVATTQSTLLRLPIDALKLTVGTVHMAFDIGWLNTSDLAKLTLVSKKFNTLTQPVITAMNWRCSLVTRMILQTTDSQDEIMSKLFKLSLDPSFDNFLDLAIKRKFPMTKVTPETHAELINKINRNVTIHPTEREILICMLPNATPLDIHNAAYKVRELGKQYPEGSEERLQYHDRSAALIEHAATHPHATLGDILNSALAFLQLGKLYPVGSNKRLQYHDRSAELYEHAATHPNATLYDILSTAKGFHELGTLHPEGSEKRLQHIDKSAELYEHAANLPNATPQNILNAVCRVRELGTKYHNKSAALSEHAANHPNATPENILTAAQGLRALGYLYPVGSNERIRYATKAAVLLKKHGLTKQN